MSYHTNTAALARPILRARHSVCPLLLRCLCVGGFMVRTCAWQPRHGKATDHFSINSIVYYLISYPIKSHCSTYKKAYSLR